MILLLGATGYVGQAFEDELRHRGLPYRALTRGQTDYTRFELLYRLLREHKPTFLINAAGFTGKPNVDACETQKAETLRGNTLFPQVLAHACAAAGVPWGHVSSGCIYSGSMMEADGKWRAERDLTRGNLIETLASTPSRFRGFSETDAPNFSFDAPPCSFYSGTKALAEEAIHGVGENYIWRLRIPFDHMDNARNYLSKVQRYSKAYQNVNSLSHRFDFVKACLDLWSRRAPFGIYNVTNPGYVTTRQVVERIGKVLRLGRNFEFWADDEEFYRVAARTPRSNCILDTTKLLSTGVTMRPVDEAVEDALRRWIPESLK